MLKICCFSKKISFFSFSERSSIVRIFLLNDTIFREKFRSFSKTWIGKKNDAYLYLWKIPNILSVTHNYLAIAYCFFRLSLVKFFTLARQKTIEGLTNPYRKMVITFFGANSTFFFLKLFFLVQYSANNKINWKPSPTQHNGLLIKKYYQQIDLI